MPWDVDPVSHTPDGVAEGVPVGLPEGDQMGVTEGVPVGLPDRVSVYVCLTSSREGLPSDAIPIAGEFTPPNACDVIPPPDSAHQPLPGEMLADGCPLGNVYGTATFSKLPFGILPGASLCDT